MNSEPTKADLRLCAMLGTNPDEVRAHRAKLDARSTPAGKGLTSADRHLCRLLGTDPDAIRAHRAKLEARDAALDAERLGRTDGLPANYESLSRDQRMKVLDRLSRAADAEYVALARVVYDRRHGAGALERLMATPAEDITTAKLAAQGIHRLSVALEGTPPDSFRLFKWGANPTSKGTYVLDKEAAESVMADFRQKGVDLPIDLEHQSLEDSETSRAYDPDARGWFQLELRSDGLYASNVKWTPDGERRIKERTQRYISPAFVSNPKTKQVLRIVNAAITSMPATHGTPALIAANARSTAKTAPFNPGYPNMVRASGRSF